MKTHWIVYVDELSPVFREVKLVHRSLYSPTHFYPTCCNTSRAERAACFITEVSGDGVMVQLKS